MVMGIMIAGLMIEPATAGKGNGKGGGGGSIPVLTPAEIDDLMFMREEEKLAHDVYVALYAEWGSPVFYNISLSEQKHTDAVLGLIVNYGLEDPASPEIGVFNNPHLQELYDLLIEMGMAGELDALEVGVLIEVTDIEDIVECMERTDRADILTVYGNLLAGSENHLAAFLRNIDANESQ
jgi:hypothetical protein